MRRLAVVGTGHAGVQIAASLRENGFDGQITLLGAETHLPYQRPPLSKGKISGIEAAQKIALRGSAYYSDRGIDMVLGERVYEVDLDAGTLLTTRGRVVEFDRLALALGAKVRHLPVPGTDLPGVLYLRDLDDALRLTAHCERATSVVVIGGGFIGLEAAALARTSGLAVTVVEADARLMGRSVAPIVSDAFATLHRERGIDVRLSARVEEVIDRGGHAGGVRLADGVTIDSDFVVVGVGVLPRTGLAKSMGLQIAGGIVVDPHSRTSDARVVAAGDCTVSARDGRYRSLESVHNATLQAKNAAKTLCGIDDPDVEVPWFWSHQGDLKLQMVGDRLDVQETVLRGEPGSGKFVALHLSGGALVGAECVNSPADFAVLKRALNTGAVMDLRLAADSAVPLKDSFSQPDSV